MSVYYIGVWNLLIIFGITSHAQCFSAELDVVISGGPLVDSGTDTTLTCTTTSSGTIREVTWKKGPFNVTFNDADAILLYNTIQGVVWSSLVDQNHYEFDQTLNGVPLTIKSVTLYDDAQYWCQLNVVGVGNQFGTAVMGVRVPPDAVVVSYLDTTYSADSAPVSVLAGSDRQFTCKANGIKPKAIFTWTHNSNMLQGTPQESTANAIDSRLFDSSNIVTIDVTETPAEQPLKCGANNRQDSVTEVEINLILQVKVPPKASLMSLYDSSMGLISPGTPLVADEGTPYTITSKVQGTRPAVSIQWLVDGAPHQATDTTSSDVNGLIDTVVTMTFTPTRDNHKKIVTCTASTTDSQSPYPFVTTALDVTGPPNTPVIEGSLKMTEGMATTLTCTAGLGYPDDWYLTWSNEGIPIEDPLPDTTADDSGTSQRYMFTSELEFTPRRQDNTHNITCTASRASWTSTPVPEKTWGPIDVQYETNITNKHQSEVGIRIGQTANLTCTAKGNPASTITWFDPNNTDIIHGGNDYKYTVVVSNKTSDTDMTVGIVTTSILSIWAVDPQVDYGFYTCNSTNGIGFPDSHKILVSGTRRPNVPPGVVGIGRTSRSIAVSWSAGYDGGETQWFHVSHKKTADSSETYSDRIDGEVTTYNVTGLESFTEYEIKVYAENDVGRYPSPDSVVEYTLRFTFLYDSTGGTVTIDGLGANGGCIQLEVKFEGIPDWTSCGDCIETDGNIKLSVWCFQTRKRRRRAIGDVETVRAKLCQLNGQLCSVSIEVMEVQTQVTDPPAPSSTGVAIGVTVGMVSIAIIVFWLGICIGRKFKNAGPEEVNLTLQRKQRSSEDKRKEFEGTSVYQEVTEMPIVESAKPDQPADMTYANVLFKDKCFPRDMLKIIKELGHGAFGEVFLAEANGILEKSKVTLVAVKTLKEGAGPIDKKDIMQELDLMKKLPDHCNVVTLLGFSVEQDPPYIIVEYLSRGNLKDLLKDSRSKEGRVYGNLHGVSKSLTSGNLVKFSEDVADGMHFISSHKCIHRDLATRNVLVAEDMTCKVSDFGLARDVIDNRSYEKRSQGRLPLRWMAIESLLDDVYTTESDVWSFGVLLWEIITLGARPYPSMSVKTMIDELQNGYRMPKPNHCQKELYKMMMKCWKEDPKSRPTFKEIGDELRTLGRKGKELISIRGYEETTYEVTIPVSDHERV